MGEIKNVLIKIGEFIFRVKFTVNETQLVMYPHKHILVILVQLFLATCNVIINCRCG